MNDAARVSFPHVHPSNLGFIVPLLAAVLFCVAVSAPKSARACSCAGSSSIRPVWPLDGASNVWLDTPIVISRNNLEGSTDALSFELLDAEGAVIELTEVNRLEPAFVGCGAPETVFLRPTHKLMPHAHYELSVHGAASMSTKAADTIEFETGTELYPAEEEIDVDVSYVRTSQAKCDGDDCEVLGETAITPDVEQPTPLWITLQSKAKTGGRITALYNPPGVSPEITDVMSVALPQDSSCIDITVHGLSGNKRFEMHSCKPHACVALERWPVSCDGPLGSGVVASSVIEGSCTNPPVLDHDMGGIDYSLVDGHEADGGGGGCAVGRGSSRASAALWMIALGLGLVRRRRSTWSRLFSRARPR